MISWRDRGRGGNSLDGGGVSSTADSDVSLPLGPGEWEEALGLPLCVVCQNVSIHKSIIVKCSPSLVGSDRYTRKRKVLERRRI